MEHLTASTILERALFEEIMSIEDEFEQLDRIEKLTDRAKVLGVKLKFEKKLKAIKKIYNKKKVEEQKKKVEEQRKVQTFQNYTQFEGPYEPLACGSWIADKNGVRAYGAMGEYLACYHPILPLKRLVNAETGKEKIVIAFNRDGYWIERIFDKSIVSSANKIQGLSDYGISVTTESAKYLVKYLNDVEHMNIDSIKKQESMSKMGWMDGYKKFMPYDAGDVVFDNESSFQSIYNSLSEKGDRAKYIEVLKQIRRRKRKEPMLCIAASLSSVLAKPCGVLPFIFHLYGEGGKGKTVAAMLAASLWGDPNEDGFIADPKATAVGFETYLNFLNHLPFICDDMAKLKKHFSAQKQGDFSEFIYFLCGGTGKIRSNIHLGINKMTNWRNCSITNGEKPLTSEISNGGELLRVIELEASLGIIFDDGQDGKATADFIRQNYGFLGKEFIKAVQEIGLEEVKKIHNEFIQKIYEMDTYKEKEGKQIMPMALMLTADKILTDAIIQDGVYLDINSCFHLIRSHEDMSDNERAYEFILNEISMHKKKFMIGEYEPDQRWGYIKEDFALINPNVFSGIAERGNFNKKMFVKWAVEKGLSEVNKGRIDKRFNAENIKGTFITVKLERDSQEDFIEITSIWQEELPF